MDWRLIRNDFKRSLWFWILILLACIGVSYLTAFSLKVTQDFPFVPLYVRWFYSFPLILIIGIHIFSIASVKIHVHPKRALPVSEQSLFRTLWFEKVIFPPLFISLSYLAGFFLFNILHKENIEFDFLMLWIFSSTLFVSGCYFFVSGVIFRIEKGKAKNIISGFLVSLVLFCVLIVSYLFITILVGMRVYTVPVVSILVSGILIAAISYLFSSFVLECFSIYPHLLEAESIFPAIVEESGAPVSGKKSVPSLKRLSPNPIDILLSSPFGNVILFSLIAFLFSLGFTMLGEGAFFLFLLPAFIMPAWMDSLRSLCILPLSKKRMFFYYLLYILLLTFSPAIGLLLGNRIVPFPRNLIFLQWCYFYILWVGIIFLCNVVIFKLNMGEGYVILWFFLLGFLGAARFISSVSVNILQFIQALLLVFLAIYWSWYVFAKTNQPYNRRASLFILV